MPDLGTLQLHRRPRALTDSNWTGTPPKPSAQATKPLADEALSPWLQFLPAAAGFIYAFLQELHTNFQIVYLWLGMENTQLRAHPQFA